MTIEFEGGRHHGHTLKDKYMCSMYEWPLDFGLPNYFIEQYEPYKFTSDTHLIVKYKGLRRLGGIKLKFDPKRLV